MGACPSCGRDHVLTPEMSYCPLTGESIATGERVGSGVVAGRRLAPGQVIASRYRVERLLGRGAMGVVAVAEDLNLGRPVALKMMRRNRRGTADEARFYREARAMAAIRDPGVVDLYDFGILADGAPFLVMELLGGESLAARIKAEAAIEVADALDIAAELLMTLASVHAGGLVHRDIKPSNVFLSDVNFDELTVKLLDFGISHLNDGSESLTGDGIAVGTPTYMSPEQILAQAVDERTDVYGVGLVLFEMLTGRTPFFPSHYESLAGFFHRVISDEPLSVFTARPALDEEVGAIVMRALSQRPRDRYATAAEMLEHISDARTDGTTSSSRGYGFPPPRR